MPPFVPNTSNNNNNNNNDNDNDSDSDSDSDNDNDNNNKFIITIIELAFILWDCQIVKCCVASDTPGNIFWLVVWDTQLDVDFTWETYY